MLCPQNNSTSYEVSFRPTFVFLKGDTKVDQVRGANPRSVCSFHASCIVANSNLLCSALQETVRRHASGSSSGAFGGKGQRLGGASSATPPEAQAPSDAPAIVTAFNQLDPSIKILVYLVAGYLLLYYFS